ncbi:methylated-DNA--[protein]-cysteine S-methyltransferase [Pedobacter cryophilus]|uniref:methylated-DNA--[protein]-cysteine S-methyltransferase n=1 Tax=Pedobacter cryophilus TaxID=2571271 RepID=A0A4U1BTP6_9SPHI|nr:methylated-DNA--[protein]-cysteine S-methyltransferase [Pedobacter cryophilus]TKB95512.1 methylated-DNA--[protein]-cysteine S-methyltransferase [Pedobacter cryophilus]
MPLIYLDSPIGNIEITETMGFISSIVFVDDKTKEEEPTSLLKDVKEQLNGYFEGKIHSFNFQMQQNGTHFQHQVWEALKEIPFGVQISYTTLSVKMKNPLAIRAIAAANGKNNNLIAIPCHRVIGMNGEMTGYAGEIWRKKWLLAHETKIAGVGQASLEF